MTSAVDINTNELYSLSGQGVVVYAAVQALAVIPSAELAKDTPATGTGTVTL
jgi:hypothetical protein